jgi:hypothetical protein
MIMCEIVSPSFDFAPITGQNRNFVFLCTPEGFQRIVCAARPRLSLSCSIIDRPKKIMTIMHFFFPRSRSIADQLRGILLKVNRVPSRRELQRCESKSRHRPKVHSRVNQNSANLGLPLLICDVNCCPSFRGLSMHINRESTRTSDCSHRTTLNHTQEQRPSVLEDANHVDSRAWPNRNQFQCR